MPIVASFPPAPATADPTVGPRRALRLPPAAPAVAVAASALIIPAGPRPGRGAA